MKIYPRKKAKGTDHNRLLRGPASCCLPGNLFNYRSVDYFISCFLKAGNNCLDDDPKDSKVSRMEAHEAYQTLLKLLRAKNRFLGKMKKNQ